MLIDLVVPPKDSDSLSFVLDYHRPACPVLAATCLISQNRDSLSADGYAPHHALPFTLWMSDVDGTAVFASAPL